MPIRRLEKHFTSGATGTVAADDLTSTALASVEHVKPHIQPGVLQPAVAGKLLNGATHSGAYGTAQTQSGGDGHKYYYTDIKGSKSIKDPRIGAHFGSQRYKFKSLQLLEQESATHGKNVYSIDGREWIRAVSGDADWYVQNDSWGQRIDNGSGCGGAIVEIVGYFNDINFMHSSHTDRCDDVDVYVNGTISVDGSTTLAGDAAVASPLGARYVDPSSVFNGGSTLSASLGTTPKINTLKFEAKTGSGEWLRFFGIELIAQDTTSTANKSKIQIPSQNVVSYGKKFTVSGTPHYNPFAFKTDGTTAWASGAHNGTAWPVGTGSSANIDTATSLGLDAWVSTNYYYPYNGGRVVWWIDTSGTLKCSVNMMPPNARNMIPTASSEKGDDSAGTTSAAVANNTYLPTFTDIAIDHSQAEVAKTFHFREFGNGNQNRGDSGTGKDLTMSNGAANKNYIMDDGLTSLAGEDLAVGGSTDQRLFTAANKDYFITFIGTGVSFNIDSGGGGAGTHHVAQNLPYGTHILKQYRDGSNANPHITIDGIQFSSVSIGSYTNLVEVTFHQPKMPPIPEDACIIADYMLMADFKIKAGVGQQYTSKGVLRKDSSKDIFYNGGDPVVQYNDDGSSSHYWMNTSDSSTAGDRHGTLTSFGTNYSCTGYNIQTRNTFDLNGSSATVTNVNTNNGHGTFAHLTNDTTLGINEFKIENTANQRLSFGFFETASPTHTSSHYQTFETPFLHELVGGDRNMEQTNLVVTADGKTWDEVTRDTSYIGKTCVRTDKDGQSTTAGATLSFDEWRGYIGGQYNVDLGGFIQKDFAVGADRVICLVNGEYRIEFETVTQTAQTAGCDTIIYVNGVSRARGTAPDFDNVNTGTKVQMPLKRGDYVQVGGIAYASPRQYFYITRIN